MSKRCFFVFCLCTCLCGCNHNNLESSDLITIDAYKNYPKLDLKLSEIADVSYIPLKTDDVLMSDRSMTRRIFVHKDKIYIGDYYPDNPKLVVFDRNGNLVQFVGSMGRGPGEYVSLHAFVVDTLTHEITIFDLRQLKFIVYNIDGKFLREKNLKEIYHDQKWIDAIEIINDDNILAYNSRSTEVSTADVRLEGMLVAKKGQVSTYGKTLLTIHKQTLLENPFQGFEFAKPATARLFTILYPLTTQRDGVYISSDRSDTIYFMNRNLEIIPKFRDVTDYKRKYGGRISPAAETERYIFFITNGASPPLYVDKSKDAPVVRKFIVYDKELEKVFLLNNSLTEKYVDDDTQMAMLNDQIAFNQYSLTLNHNYAITSLSPRLLIEHYNQLPEALKEIAKGIREDDNPVLMLMKLR